MEEERRWREKAWLFVLTREEESQEVHWESYRQTPRIHSP